MATWRDLPGVRTVTTPVIRTAEALWALPGTVASLNTSVRALGDTVAAAQEAMASVQRVAVRLEHTLDDIEEPLRALAPGLRRAAGVLDDPAIDTIPEVLRQVREQALPLLKTVTDTQDRMAGLAATIPGAAALFGLGTRRAPTRVIESDQPPDPE